MKEKDSLTSLLFLFSFDTIHWLIFVHVFSWVSHCLSLSLFLFYCFPLPLHILPHLQIPVCSSLSSSSSLLFFRLYLSFSLSSFRLHLNPSSSTHYKTRVSREGNQKREGSPRSVFTKELRRHQIILSSLEFFFYFKSDRNSKTAIQLQQDFNHYYHHPPASSPYFRKKLHEDHPLKTWKSPSSSTFPHSFRSSLIHFHHPGSPEEGQSWSHRESSLLLSCAPLILIFSFFYSILILSDSGLKTDINTDPILGKNPHLMILLLMLHWTWVKQENTFFPLLILRRKDKKQQTRDTRLSLSPHLEVQ